MRSSFNPPLRRRELIHGLVAGSLAAVASTTPHSEAMADSESDSEKRRARYQASSPEVQAFYRVNRYPAP